MERAAPAPCHPPSLPPQQSFCLAALLKKYLSNCLLNLQSADSKDRKAQLERETTLSSNTEPFSVRPRNKAEAVAQILRDEIATGTFPPGTRLPAESELIARFGVSRPSFREALRILESERLISVNRGPRGGAVIRTPDLEPIARSIGVLLQLQGASILDIFRARSLIEPELVRSIAANPETAPLAELASCAAAQRFSLSDLAAYKREELYFRQLLISHSSSITLANLATLLSAILESKLLALPPVPETSATAAELRRGVRAKEKLISLIESGKPEEAEASWRAYLDSYADRLTVRIMQMTTDPSAAARGSRA
jgi:GntR family transcriptional regulator, transcriptional repressor for pyruvate dehydrogenase complex